MRVLLVLILSTIPTISSATTHQEYFDTYLNTLTSKLRSWEYPGPLSRLVARVALARQSLEDGLNRKSNVSIAGISTGGFNKEVVDQTILKSGLSVGYAFDADGGRFYVFKGDQANVFSALCIARLFNVYVGKFLGRDQKSWNLAKEISKAILQKPDSFELNQLFYVKLRPDKIIEKANRLYGPKHESVIRIANGYESD
ncbi:MAG: hypothetical protein M1511_13275 [Deltaproteobacteria bacterium]|nr:hypothetical protein [Deltaproteobacteria bacterium]